MKKSQWKWENLNWMIKMEHCQKWGPANTMLRGKVKDFLISGCALWCKCFLITATGRNSVSSLYVAFLAHSLAYSNHSWFLLFIITVVILADVWENSIAYWLSSELWSHGTWVWILVQPFTSYVPLCKYLTSLCLNLLIDKVGIMAVLYVVRIKWVNPFSNGKVPAILYHPKNVSHYYNSSEDVLVGKAGKVKMS